MIRLLLLAALSAQLPSCHHITEELPTHVSQYAIDYEDISDSDILPPSTQEPSQHKNKILKSPSKIIKHGAIRLQVQDLHVAKDRIDRIVARYHAYYENEKYQSQSEQLTYTLKIRIPSAQFDSLIEGVEHGIGEIKSKNINIQDVSEEYTDHKIRLENKIAYLNKYKEILKKAKSVKDILEVQDNIRYIEVEIESKKGRLKYLNDQIGYSTLQLTVYQDTSIDSANSLGFGSRLFDAIDYGASLFSEFVIGIVSLWPFIVVLFVVFIFRKPVLLSFKKA